VTALFNYALGGTNGTTVSAANSGGASGDAFDSVVGTPTITFDNTHSLGGLSYKLVNPPSAQQLVWSTKLGTVGELWGRFFIWYDTAPTAPVGLIRPTTGGSQASRIRINSDGTLTLADSGNAAEITTASALPTGQWVRCEWYTQFVSTSAQVNLMTWNTAGSTGTPTENLSASAGGIGVNADAVQIGGFNAATFTCWLAGLAVHNEPARGFLGPIRLPQPATAKLSAVQRSVTY
jgi:hypothetical protein